MGSQQPLSTVREVMLRLALIGLVMCSVLVALPAAHADKDSAKQYLDRAVEYFTYKRYESAAREFEKAYKEDADSRTLFAWAQAERLAGNCVKGTLLYQQFLATKPEKAAAEAADFGIAECKKVLDKAAATAAKSDGSDTTPPDDRKNDRKNDHKKNGGGSGSSTTGTTGTGTTGTTGTGTTGTTGTGTTGTTGGNTTIDQIPDGPPVDGPSEPGPWYTDRPAALLTGGGGGLVVASLALYISARGLANTAPDEASNEAEFDDIVSKAAFRRNLAVAVGVAGAAAATLGVFRYKRLRDEQRSSVLVTPTIGSESAGILVTGWF